MIELQRSRLFLALLAAISAIGPLSMQIFLPALPAIQREFGAPAGIVQLSLSLSMVSIALATLAYGPLSDRYGRRPVLIAGLLLFLAGSTLCALAANVWVLIAGRIVQAAGGTSGMVLSRAIVRDVYPRERVASVIATLTMAMVVAPMLAPAVGGLLTDLYGWRANFAFVAIAGGVVSALVLPRLEETNPALVPMAGVAAVVGRFARLLRAPIFCGYVFQGAFSAALFFAFISGAPYVMVNVLGRPATEYGLYFILLALAYMAGNYLVARSGRGGGAHRTLVLGSLLALAGTVLAAVLVMGWAWSPPLIFGPAIVIAFASGLTMPHAQAGAVSHDPEAAGTASGLSGFLQMTVASLFAQAVGSLQDDTPYAMVGFMVAAAALSLASISLPLWLDRARAASR